MHVFARKFNSSESSRNMIKTPVLQFVTWQPMATALFQVSNRIDAYTIGTTITPLQLADVHLKDGRRS